VAQLNEQGISCHLTLTMELDRVAKTLGGDKDAFLLRKAMERGQVTMLGSIPYQQLPTIYKNHDLFIFPSLSETFGHPLAEAMSSGLPIIAADTPVHREVCKDSALYFSPLLPSDLVRQVQILEDNKALRNSLTERGFQNVSSNFVWEAHVDRLLDAFGKVAGVPVKSGSRL